MNKQAQQIEIAKNFIGLHKKDNVSDWTPLDEFDLDKKYIAIFNKLHGGEYGDLNGTNFIMDDNEEVVKEATEFEIEISAFDAKGDTPIIFDYEYNDHE